MNIVQAFTKFNNQAIILVSGLSGSGKMTLARFIAKVFKFELIDLKDYFKTKEQYDLPENYKELSDGTKVLDWDDLYKSVNWDSLKNSVDIKCKNGCVVCGMGFPQGVIGFKPDFHIHIKISKELLIEKRHEYLKTHNDSPFFELMGTDREKQILNRLTYPNYLKIRDDMKVDRFMNVTEIATTLDETSSAMDKICDEVFKYLLQKIQQWIDQYNQKIVGTRKFKEDNPYDGKTNLAHQGKATVYDDYFYNKKKKRYDHNDEGVDYPEDISKNTSSSSNDSNNDSNDDSNNDSKTDDSDMTFMGTIA